MSVKLHASSCWGNYLLFFILAPGFLLPQGESLGMNWGRGIHTIPCFPLSAPLYHYMRSSLVLVFGSFFLLFLTPGTRFWRVTFPWTLPRGTLELDDHFGFFFSYPRSFLYASYSLLYLILIPFLPPSHLLRLSCSRGSTIESLTRVILLYTPS